MQRVQIYLSEHERQGLQSLALRRGRSQSALIREAIDGYLEREQPHQRLAQLRNARGLWAGRDDLPDWPQLRQELDTQPASLPHAQRSSGALREGLTPAPRSPVKRTPMPNWNLNPHRAQKHGRQLS